MTTTTIFPFTNASNYTVSDSDKIEVADGVAKLKAVDNAGETFTEDYADDTGFTYTAAEAEFAAGVLQQKSQKASGVTFAAAYTADSDGSFGGGVLTATETGTVAITGEKLDLTGDGHVDYAALNNADAAQVIYARFKMTPNYSGSPAVAVYVLNSTKAASDSDNLVTLYHKTNGDLAVFSRNDAGGIIVNAAFGAWSPTAGVEYRFYFKFDITAGSIQLFIDSSQLGSTNTSTGTRNISNIGLFRVGKFYDGSGASDFLIRDLEVGTSDFGHATYETSQYEYVETKVELPVMTYAGLGAVQAFTGFALTDANSPKYVLNDEYWNGAAWVASDGTYAQASSEADVNTNIASLTVADTLYVDTIFQNSSTQGTNDDLTVTYTGQAYPTDDPYLTINSTFWATELTDFTGTETITGSDAIKYVLFAGAQGRYITGAAAADSDGTYSQASPDTDIDTYITDIISARKNVSIRIYLHSADGTTTPELDSLSVAYNLALSPATVPTLVNVEGFVYDSNSPVASQAVEVRPFGGGFWNESVFHRYEWETIGTTDADGHFSGNVYLQPTGKFWEFRILNKRYKATLLDQSEMALKDAPVWTVIEVTS